MTLFSSSALSFRSPFFGPMSFLNAFRKNNTKDSYVTSYRFSVKPEMNRHIEEIANDCNGNYEEVFGHALALYIAVKKLKSQQKNSRLFLEDLEKNTKTEFTDI